MTDLPPIPGLVSQTPLNIPVDAGPYRVRIIATGVARAGDLYEHDGNPFVPTEFQQRGLQGSLKQVGIVDVLKVYVSARNNGRLTLLDGHKRRGMHAEQLWPVVVLDIDDDEADAQLLVHNMLGAWSGIDPRKMNELVQQAKMKNEEMAAAKERIRVMIADQVAIDEKATGGGDGRDRQFGFEEALKTSVKVVIPVTTELPIIERALKVTGQKRRGAALLEICQFYLEHKHE